MPESRWPFVACVVVVEMAVDEWVLVCAACWTLRIESIVLRITHLDDNECCPHLACSMDSWTTIWHDDIITLLKAASQVKPGLRAASKTGVA